MGTLLDLDIIRPEKNIIKLHGKEIDVSFIPAGITFDLDAITAEMAKLDLDKVQDGGDETKKAFELGVRLCSVFCTIHYPEMTPDWFNKNVDPTQIRLMADAIKDSLAKIYEDMGAYSKNAEAGSQ